MNQAGTLSLVVRRVIRSTPTRLFQAWTTPDQLQTWWGPRGVRCTHAEIDLRVGGLYRIANELPDGRVLWIVGEFLVVDPPERLIYTWRLEPGDAAAEQVTVRFIGRESDTEVVVVHERIASHRDHAEHGTGWDGCLSGLATFCEGRD